MAKPPRFNVGDDVPGGKKVKRIIGQSDQVLVYVTEQGTIAYDVVEPDPPDEKMADHLRLCLTHFKRLYPEAKRVYFDAEWDSVRDELGAALYSALTANDPEECNAAYHAVNARITAKIADRGRLYYLLSALGTSGVLFAIALAAFLWFEPSKYSLHFACAMSAIAGSLASVITRTSTLSINPFEDARVTALRGGFRILLAILIASFLLMAAKANLIAGLVFENESLLLAYAFLCGFSERFGPEILANFEPNAKARSTKR